MKVPALLSSPTNKYIDFLNQGKMDNKTSRAGIQTEEDDEA